MIIGKTNAGGGLGGFAYIVVSYPSGAICTCTNSGTSCAGSKSEKSALFSIPSIGNWTISITDSSHLTPVSKTVSITYKGQVEKVQLSFRVPSEYQEVEYISSSGTQYIHLPGEFTINDVVEIRLKYSTMQNMNADRTVFCLNRNTTNTNATKYMIYHSSGNSVQAAYRNRLDFRYYRSDGYSKEAAGLIPSLNTIYDIYAKYDSQKVYLDIGVEGEEPQHTEDSGTRTSSTTHINLFAYASDSAAVTIGTSECIRKFLKITKNGADVYNFIPCYRISDNVAGVYDNINNEFHTNSATSGPDFVLGPNVP